MSPSSNNSRNYYYNMELFPLELLSPELIGQIIDRSDYQTLKALAITNTFFLNEIRAFFNRLVLKAREKFPQAATIEKHELIERISYLNGYKTITIEGIFVNETTWSKGKNKIITTPEIQQWLQNEELHRIDGPAQTRWENEIKTEELWCQNNILHRANGPAIMRWENEKKTEEEWWNNGNPHRIGDPAITNWTNEIKTKEQWYCDGNLHRIDGPANTRWENGIKIIEQWRVNENCIDGHVSTK